MLVGHDERKNGPTSTLLGAATYRSGTENMLISQIVIQSMNPVVVPLM
jgi:hypothetical protein